MNDVLAVNEIFGPTFQGEGRNIGQPVMFLRLAGCNLKCVWCDTPYAWDWQGVNGTKYDPRVEMRRMDIDSVCVALTSSPVRHLVISGGEPMLQQKALSVLTRRLHATGWYTEIETAGTIAPESTELVKQFNVSIKLASSGNAWAKRFNPVAVHRLAASGRAVFKFVATDLNDFDEIDTLVHDWHLTNVYIMPEGRTSAALAEHMTVIADAAIARGYNVTPRLHIDLYGPRRGV